MAICAGNSPVPDEFPAQRPVTWSFDVFFDLHLNKRLSKQSWGWWFETLSCPLWLHCNENKINSSQGILFRSVVHYEVPWLFRPHSAKCDISSGWFSQGHDCRWLPQLLIAWQENCSLGNQKSIKTKAAIINFITEFLLIWNITWPWEGVLTLIILCRVAKCLGEFCQ